MPKTRRMYCKALKILLVLTNSIVTIDNKTIIPITKAKLFHVPTKLPEVTPLIKSGIRVLKLTNKLNVWNKSKTTPDKKIDQIKYQTLFSD